MAVTHVHVYYFDILNIYFNIINIYFNYLFLLFRCFSTCISFFLPHVLSPFLVGVSHSESQ